MVKFVRPILGLAIMWSTRQVLRKEEMILALATSLLMGVSVIIVKEHRGYGSRGHLVTVALAILAVGTCFFVAMPDRKAAILGVFSGIGATLVGMGVGHLVETLVRKT